jgi:L-lysine 6-transaminase
MITAYNALEKLSEHVLLDGFDFVIDLQKSKGSWLADKKSGELYLDFCTMYAIHAIGYNHPKLMEKVDELGKVAVQKPSCSHFYTMEMAEFVETFSEIGIPDTLPHAFFIDGGALAIENALKTAFDWKTRKNHSKSITGHNQLKIISLKDSFHGRSGYTLSITNSANPWITNYFPQFVWPIIVNPTIQFPLNQKNIEKVKSLERESIKQIKNIIQAEKDDIAGLVLEPIQGQGGDNHFRPEYFQSLRKICTENEILLILDEIQTGVGMTGKFWAYEHYGIEPDILCFGKKLQVSGLLAGKRINEVEDNVFQKKGRIVSTFGGNLVDMVRATHILRIIKEENLVENARIQGEYLLNKLKQLTGAFPSLLLNPRGKGLICAFDFYEVEKRDEFIEKMFQANVLVVGGGVSCIRFRPHLTITQDEIDQGIATMQKILKDLK